MGISHVLLGCVVVLGVGVMGVRLRDRRTGLTAPGAPVSDSGGSGSESLTATAGAYGRLHVNSVTGTDAAKYGVL